VDAYAGWDPKYRLAVRVVTSRAYHALFMQNMLVMPASAEELKTFKPEFTIYNGGAFPAEAKTTGRYRWGKVVFFFVIIQTRSKKIFF
jgi:phosphoenolpyruvate carboxykinase (ATP)